MAVSQASAHCCTEDEVVCYAVFYIGPWRNAPSAGGVFLHSYSGNKGKVSAIVVGVLAVCANHIVFKAYDIIAQLLYRSIYSNIFAVHPVVGLNIVNLSGEANCKAVLWGEHLVVHTVKETHILVSVKIFETVAVLGVVIRVISNKGNVVSALAIEGNSKFCISAYAGVADFRTPYASACSLSCALLVHSLAVVHLAAYSCICEGLYTPAQLRVVAKYIEPSVVYGPLAGHWVI